MYLLDVRWTVNIKVLVWKGIIESTGPLKIIDGLFYMDVQLLMPLAYYKGILFYILQKM
jgi:hypothetical protein